MRHDEPKELFAREASELWRNVGVEPMLEELSGEVLSYKSAKVENDCRSDVRVRGFGLRSKTFFKFRIFLSVCVELLVYFHSCFVKKVC